MPPTILPLERRVNEDVDPHEESIKVCCRFRPQNQMERDNSGRICFDVLGDASPTINTVYVPQSDLTYVFDRVFRWDAGQKEVYDYAAKPIINAVLRGFNGTVFAYGQTSSGKTYTMEGPDIEDKHYQGVIPRMVWSIFDGIYHADESIEFLVKVSIVEIYNERIRDLLNPKKDNLKVHEDKTRGVSIGEVTESYVGCEQEIFDAMRAGHYNRSMAVTNMNEHSSRSHLVFMLTIEQKNLHDRSVKVGKLHLVDLAGSEKVCKTGASGERLDEAKNINRSLSALGNVINALTDKKYTHVPYRDSKLTRVLQESLGGNAKTSLIITCSPSNFNEQETISTLRFGQRAKMIKNVVKVNHERSAEELKLLLEKKDHFLVELRGRVNAMEQLLRAHNISPPEEPAALQTVTSPTVSSQKHGMEKAEIFDQLQEMREKLKLSAEQATEKNRQIDELQTLLRFCHEEKADLQNQMLDVKIDREKVEYERNEKLDEVERLRVEKDALLQEIEELHRTQSLMAQGSPREGSRNNSHAAPAGREVRESELERLRDADRPLKRKVSQLDKNLELLTVMYHKLVAQNSGLKVEVTEGDKKIQRKDQRIGQLERNLREAKQKYEKLLTQCANMTAAMDAMNRGKAVGTLMNVAASGTGSSQVRRAHNIVRPVKGGAVPRHEASDGHTQGAVSAQLGESASATNHTDDSPSRREGSKPGTSRSGYPAASGGSCPAPVPA
mmetsp:Transcript_30689/g.60242  ORF Transcript_30689/g.60242 Transcript_30689/m.60242 type:complete len:726 (-) Transcript_30689:291-2468(-)|eukprot:CAMPEP_0172712404 /NCGR_PEP_ID=MMETSP1074-20121228/61075_1 /TAXON_ID=2916 /ORGANISM="Ceratium fusus, Strain PA161109" /LENGTH=725 /DNA_ID=CAMNT_0013536325 /DNA_START=110 /DNA_END=2287 /DNA_ORIENTATION=-